jgi:hypothetical protein
MDFSLGLWTAPFPATSGRPASSTGHKDPSPPTTNQSGSIFEIDSDDFTARSLDGKSKHGTPDHEDLPDQPSQVVVRLRNKPIPRKGHTKSRRGCYNCKRRKVKCNETKPRCSNCIKAEVNCDYPRGPQQEIHALGPISQPQSTPTVFSMTDLKLFHHFIVVAYPHLPIGADETWKQEIPAFAHEVSIESHHGLHKHADIDEV